MTTTTPLVHIGSVLQAAALTASANGRELDPAYTWTVAAMAENLLELEEQVFTNGGNHYITEDTAETLKIYIQDFTVPARDRNLPL